MRCSIAELLGDPPEAIADDDELVRCGLDSIGIMRLANKWRRYGVNLSFAELINQPTVGRCWIARLLTPGSTTCAQRGAVRRICLV
jgi:nonribosomal peptide synthetase MxcG